MPSAGCCGCAAFLHRAERFAASSPAPRKECKKTVNCVPYPYPEFLLLALLSQPIRENHREPQEGIVATLGVGRSRGGERPGGIGRRHLRRRRHLPLSDLLEVGGRLQEGDRDRLE